jgi:phenylalanyl-tRNA synthetase alpha chain
MTTELELHDLVREALRAISKVASEAEADDIRIRYLGRKGGRLTEVTKSLKDLPPEQKRVVGPVANRLKGLIEKTLAAYKQGDMAAIREAIESEIQNEGGKLLLFGLVEVSGDSSNFEEAGTVSGPRVDLTVPGRSQPLGHKHPLIQTMEDIVEVLSRLGYTVAEGPEIELDSYNFEALNIPRDHPARDMQDTFYISDDVLLRTHTSPVQIRVMEMVKPPVKIIAPGKVFRCDADVTHSPMFHQIEGLYVDKGLSFADLKGTLETFVHEIFGPEFRIRLRPSFFPFTEPSAEVDIACDHLADGRWLEVLGAGMVDPAVFEAVGYDPEAWSGFAWGIGVERVAMLRYGISDIRMFFENDVRMLQQF